MMGNGWFWGHMGFGWFIWLIILAVFVWLVVQIASRNRSGGEGSTRTETPLEILKKRYARGEISKEEFERMKNDLME
ncbi:MAG TPA: SHOCT domain-containing protein [Calditrichae bacterium]|nr:SHOCT domain-containing protein [Calditrichia bacterium]